MNYKIILALISVLAIIVGIITDAQTLIGFPPIKNWEIFKSNKDFNLDLGLVIEPEFIQEGQYDDGVPITISIPNIYTKNITYLKLRGEDILIDRINKTDQTKSSSSIRWNDNDDFPLYYNPPYSGSEFDTKLVATGYLLGCNNCFFGENSPYRFKFIIKYKTGDGLEDVITIEKIIPIR